VACLRAGCQSALNWSEITGPRPRSSILLTPMSRPFRWRQNRGFSLN